MRITDFGLTKDGTSTKLYTYKTKLFELAVSDFGATLVDLKVAGKDNVIRDIVLGYDDALGYEEDAGNYFGANVGRNANRIGGAGFELAGETYQLDKNDGNNNLHSGFSPYSKRMWKVVDKSEDSITFSLESPHMDQGYPGNLVMNVTYKILSDNSFGIVYEATPDMDTIINMTNHSYFNLNGEGNGDILNHKVILYSQEFTPSDEEFIPTGEIVTVEGTPMDFRKGKVVGEEIGADYAQLINAGGYDHNWITGQNGVLHNIVKATGDISGITLNVATDYPGVQFYTGNFLNGVKGKKGHTYGKNTGMCFEPQFYPNAINIHEFISPICKKGELYRREILYSFGDN